MWCAFCRTASRMILRLCAGREVFTTMSAPLHAFRTSATFPRFARSDSTSRGIRSRTSASRSRRMSTMRRALIPGSEPRRRAVTSPAAPTPRTDTSTAGPRAGRDEVAALEPDGLEVRDHVPRVPLDEGPHVVHALLPEVRQEGLSQGLPHAVALERGGHSHGLHPSHLTLLPAPPRPHAARR